MSFQEETRVHGWACNVIMDQERGAAEIKIRPNSTTAILLNQFHVYQILPL